MRVRKENSETMFRTNELLHAKTNGIAIGLFSFFILLKHLAC